MIDIQNLRLEETDLQTRIVMDISSDVPRRDKESVIWVGVEKQYADLLASDVYDLCLFFPMCVAMYYHTDLHIHGCVSKTLYKNMVDYVQPILTGFLDALQLVNVHVDSFKECEGKHDLIGTGISCGVDCLSTIYDKFVLETDPEYKLNALFNFNCGWHGGYGREKTLALFNERCKENAKAADDLHLPLIAVDSNLHAFLPFLGEIAYLALYSCVFALESGISKYYLSGCYSYNQFIEYGNQSRNLDWSEYGDAMAIPLMRSKTCELISDGCQYPRSEKTERIADWDITKKYLNVCCKNLSTKNCSVCNKCIRTLLPLDAMGKLEEYRGIFDLEKYRKIRYKEQCRMVLSEGRYAFSTDNLTYSRRKGVRLPSRAVAFICRFPVNLRDKIVLEFNKLKKRFV